MKIERRQTIRIASSLPIDLLPVAHIEKAVLVGLYFRIQTLHTPIFRQRRASCS